MTNPDHHDHTDAEPGAGVEALVRATLTAVAERTDLAAGPFDGRAGDDPSLEDLRSRAAVARDEDDAVALVVTSLAAGRGTEHRDPGRRRWAVVAAAALVAVLVGVLGVAADQRTVTTGVGGPGAPASTAVAGPPLIVGAPRDVLGLELMDVQTATWYGPNTPGSVRPPSTPAMPAAPFAERIAGETVHPFVETGSAGATIFYTYFPPGEEPVLLVTAESVTQPRLRVVVKMGVTVDPAARSAMAGVPSDVIDGLVVAPATEVCGLTSRATWPPQTDTSPGTTLPGQLPHDPSACRTIQLAWTDHSLIIVDAEPGLAVDDVIAGLQGEELGALEARLAGISDTGRIRRSLEEAMPWMLPAADGQAPPAPRVTVAPPAPPGTIAPN